MLLLTVEPVEAYYYYYNSWYIYVIVVFVIVAISSCIGACVRHRRNQMFLEQQRQLMSQGITIQTGTGAANPGYYPGYNTQGGQQYPTPPPGGLVQQPPPYVPTANTAEKDPNMPPAYEDAVNTPAAPGQDQNALPGYPPYPAAPGGYPPNSANPPAANTTAPPYPQQPAPYPTQAPAPYPTQPPAPYSAPYPPTGPNAPPPS